MEAVKLYRSANRMWIDIRLGLLVWAAGPSQRLFSFVGDVAERASAESFSIYSDVPGSFKSLQAFIQRPLCPNL